MQQLPLNDPSPYYPMLTCGDISDFLFTKIGDNDLLHKDTLLFTKIKFIKADLQDIYDIQENKLNNAYILIIFS